jgi:hypothetical protein
LLSAEEGFLEALRLGLMVKEFKDVRSESVSGLVDARVLI